LMLTMKRSWASSVNCIAVSNYGSKELLHAST
jgi:hypothetical protein